MLMGAVIDKVVRMFAAVHFARGDLACRRGVCSRPIGGAVANWKEITQGSVQIALATAVLCVVSSCAVPITGPVQTDAAVDSELPQVEIDSTGGQSDSSSAGEEVATATDTPKSEGLVADTQLSLSVKVVEDGSVSMDWGVRIYWVFPEDPESSAFCMPVNAKQEGLLISGVVSAKEVESKIASAMGASKFAVGYLLVGARDENPCTFLGSKGHSSEVVLIYSGKGCVPSPFDQQFSGFPCAAKIGIAKTIIYSKCWKSGTKCACNAQDGAAWSPDLSAKVEIKVSTTPDCKGPNFY